MVGFRSYVTDAIKDWEMLYCKRPERQLSHKDEHVALSDDDERTGILRELIRDYFVSFEGWITEEVVLFIYSSYPSDLLLELTKSGSTSRFLNVIHEHWKPTFLQWVNLLWLVCGKACEFFTDLLYLLPERQQPVESGRRAQIDMGFIGEVLFRDMISMNSYSWRTCTHVIGAYLPYPDECSFGWEHFEMLCKLSSKLSAIDAGFVFRSLLLYRAHRRRNCECGYARGEESCMCEQKSIRNGWIRSGNDELESDPFKEYACVILKLILEMHHVEAVVTTLRWTEEEQDDFVKSACERVFCAPVYIEIYQNLRQGRKPTKEQEYPRTLTDAERLGNTTRNLDNDYNHSLAQHGGCVKRNCKQSMKTLCANLSCKQHCELAYKRCKVHRYFPQGIEYPEENRRRNIRKKSSISMYRGRPEPVAIDVDAI